MGLNSTAVAIQPNVSCTCNCKRSLFQSMEISKYSSSSCCCRGAGPDFPGCECGGCGAHGVPAAGRELSAGALGSAEPLRCDGLSSGDFLVPPLPPPVRASSQLLLLGRPVRV